MTMVLGGPRGGAGGVRARPAVVVAVLYVAVAVAGQSLPAGELYPFFTWDLFSTVPQQTVRAALYVEASDGPTELSTSGVGRGSMITASSLARDLWAAVREDPAATESLAEVIVGNHLPTDARWSLRVERFDPVSRLRDGALDTYEVATFRGARREAAHGFVAGERVIRRGHVRWERSPGPVGRLERVTRDGATVALSGWAATPTGALPEHVVVLGSDGTVVGRTSVGVPRGDVRDALGTERALTAGFALALNAGGVPVERLTVLALFEDGSARPVEARP